MIRAIDLDRRARKQRLIADVPFWFHSIDLGDGVVTDGHKSQQIIADELLAMNLPSLVGKSVLDIGAWDGAFSFETERRGAARVVALDRYTQRGNKDRQLNKRGFDACHQALNSRVESVVDEFMTMDLAALGTFDVTLYLGVLYHEPHVLLGLERLRTVTTELAVIESEMAYFPGFEALGLARFFAGDELNADPTNWWVPNMTALIGLVRLAGFREVRVLKGPPREYDQLPLGHEPAHYRGIFHALV